ncbi:IS5 family transposase [Streptomyces sp. NBC_01460]|nr:IS5 family transposase [Streptomyces sp. NBC_01460]
MLEPLLPKGTRAGRPPVWSRRQLIDGIRFRVRTGVPWRDVPTEYGPWGRVYDLFRRWQRDGSWHRIFTQPQSQADLKGAITWDLSVDSTVCRAHQHAAGARKLGDLQKEPPGGVFTEPRDHGLGRSRGGFTTKLHLAVEQGQKLMSIVVTAGQRGDSPHFKLAHVLDEVLAGAFTLRGLTDVSLERPPPHQRAARWCRALANVTGARGVGGGPARRGQGQDEDGRRGRGERSAE